MLVALTQSKCILPGHYLAFQTDISLMSSSVVVPKSHLIYSVLVESKTFCHDSSFLFTPPLSSTYIIHKEHRGILLYAHCDLIHHQGNVILECWRGLLELEFCGSRIGTERLQWALPPYLFPHMVATLSSPSRVTSAATAQEVARARALAVPTTPGSSVTHAAYAAALHCRGH
jgi:hypothetical protein